VSTDNDQPHSNEAEILHQERERIRTRIGAIGGKSRRKIDRAINITFLVIVVALFVLEVGFKLLPALISLEIAVLLVSIKVVIVMTSLQRVSHYEFWILNTIDFRISQLENSVRAIERGVDAQDPSRKKRN
jgi:hypothetical protein